MNVLLLLLLWTIVLVLCWPLALLVLVLFPLVWIVALPFRIGYWVVEGALGLVRGLLLLPARLLGAGRR